MPGLFHIQLSPSVAKYLLEKDLPEDFCLQKNLRQKKIRPFEGADYSVPFGGDVCEAPFIQL